MCPHVQEVDLSSTLISNSEAMDWKCFLNALTYNKEWKLQRFLPAAELIYGFGNYRYTTFHYDCAYHWRKSLLELCISKMSATIQNVGNFTAQAYI